MEPKMKIRVLAVTLIVGIAAFLTEPNGPLGGFWIPAHDVPEAVGIQVPLFMALGLTEALVCGAGIAFLLFGYSLVRFDNVSSRLARATHLSITWVMVNWWAHDSLHLHNGMDLSGLLKIEYGFHFTLMAAGLTLAWFFLSVARRPAVVTSAV
jgi:hypothetical protein